MSLPPRPRSGRRSLLLLAAAGLSCVVAFGVQWRARAGDGERARALAGVELATFERCLVGAPLLPGEALASRLRGIELGLELQRDAQAPRGDKADKLDEDADAGADAGAVPLPVDPASQWPGRCAPAAEALARTLDAAAMRADDRLDALREALPTRQRLALPYALLPAEAADLAAAIAAANLPAATPATDVEPAPTALATPPAMGELTPLGKGKLGGSIDVLATRPLRLILHGARARLCTLDPDDGKADHATARCGDLPDWMATNDHLPRLAYLADGAPTAIFAAKGTAESSPFGVAILTPGGLKTLPMSGSGGTAGAFVAADGAYMLTSSGYGAFVRVGSVDKLKTTDLAERALDATAVRAVDAVSRDAVPAYGWVFWTDPRPVYASSDPSRRLWGRQVQPTLAAKPVELGVPPDDLAIAAGCRGGGRTALVFDADARPADQKRMARVVVADGEGPFRAFDAEVGVISPHLLCAPDAAVITSIGPAKERDALVVIESRCTAAGCQARRSEPIPALGGELFEAAALDAGVALVWRTRADRVLSRARSMGFYRVAPLDKLAATPPRPLLEDHRRGGLDVDRIRLVSRGATAIVALASGGKSPVTSALRIDAAGAVSPVRVEETKW